MWKIIILLCLWVQQPYSQKVYIKFGNTSTACDGFGICTIKTNRPDPTYAPGVLEIKGQGLSLKINKSDLSDKDFLKYFATGNFIIENDYYCQLEKLYIIKKGKYRVEQDKDYYIINFL